MTAVTVRLPKDDYNALDEEATKKGMALAACLRDILQAHLHNKDLSEKIESEFARLLDSDKYDDVIVEKFIRAYDKKRIK